MTSLPGSFLATGNIPSATTSYKKHPLSSLFSICNGAMQYNNRVFLYGERLIRVNLNWIRDYMLTVKGFRYTERDLTSFPDLLLEKQHESGFFYEIIAPLTDYHSGFVSNKQPDGTSFTLVEDPYRLHEPDTDFGLCRLELEADIEYLMVEGCFLIWQATGDDDWLRTQLPRLEKGLRYMTSSPIRFDAKLQLVKRPHTLDTWDFTDRASSSLDRMIRTEDPMGIFHGDNTGLFYAHTLLARIYRYFGNESAADQHEREAGGLRERIMKLLWNGQFFRHFLMLDAADYGVDTKKQLSLSNAYALNRAILSLSEKRKIIKSYQSCREKYRGELDDFRNLEPPFPLFHGMKAGQYVNGAIAPFVAGQLALGAFESGEEEYGADILDRIGCKFLRDGKISFLYGWDGMDIGGDPRCLCGAEIMNALTAGLAGVTDQEKLFEKVVLSPRFAAADETRAHVRLEYAASRAFCEYTWSIDRKANCEKLQLLSKHTSCKVRMYVPCGTTPTAVLVNHISVEFRQECVEKSHYALIDNLKCGDILEVKYQ